VRAGAAGLGGLIGAFHGDFQSREQALRGEPAITSRTSRPVNVDGPGTGADKGSGAVKVFTVDK
jgi:hypothetical protein